MNNRKQIVEILVVCLFFVGLAGYVETTNRKLDQNGRIERGRPGGGSTSVELTLDAEGILEEYRYPLKVEERLLPAAEAVEQFTAAKQEIEQSFYALGDHADSVTQAVHMKDTYVNGLVGADWSLDNYRVVDSGGMIAESAVPAEGAPVQATVKLSCGNYSDSYCFGFRVFPSRTPQEELLAEIEEAIEREQEKEGTDYLMLPESVDGHSLRWSQRREYLVYKVLLFEAVIVVLLHFVKLEREREREKKRKEEMMLDYAEVVNKLLILLGSGMSLRQAWNRIAARYLDKRQKDNHAVRHIYEEIAAANFEMQDGESDRTAFQRFGERTGLGSYHRLVRILIQNLHTGSRGLCELLEQETESALEERKALAKKLGEEAGTKMLLPLMIMLVIVMAIIMAPAILSFRI